MSDFPKYQFSVFLKEGRDEQIVIRTDTFEELLEAKKNINKILDKVESKQGPTEEAEVIICNMCGERAEARSGISKKNGKKWSAWFCSTGIASHTKFL